MSHFSYLLILVALIVALPFGTGADGNLDDDIYTMKPEDDPMEYGLERLDKIIQIYNFTESIEKRYMRLREMDPYGVANQLVDTVTEKIKAMTQHYNDLRKLLARESTRGPGKRQYDNLYHQADLLHQEIQEAEEHIAVVQDRNWTDVAEEAIKIQESLKADIVNITKEHMREELGTCVVELENLKLFPPSVEEFEKDEKWPRNTFPFIDRPALNNFYNLFKRAAEIGQQVEDAFFGDENDETDDMMDYADFARTKLMEFDKQLTQITAIEIPEYIKKHQRPLSRILLITSERLDEFEFRVKKLDIESALLGAQEKVMEKVYLKLAAASEDYNKAITEAEKIYQKYYDIEALKQSKPPAPPVVPELSASVDLDRDEL